MPQLEEEMLQGNYKTCYVQLKREQTNEWHRMIHVEDFRAKKERFVNYYFR